MKLCTIEQVQDLRKPEARKRKDYDELGPLLYDCWLTSMIRYLERRQARKLTSVKGTSSQA